MTRSIAPLSKLLVTAFIAGAAAAAAGGPSLHAAGSPQGQTDPRYPGRTAPAPDDDEVRRAVEEGARRRREYEQARRLAAGVDPGIVALRDCDHSMRNASGAPWTIERSAQHCDEVKPKTNEGAPELKGSVEECWNFLDTARDKLRQANEKYEQAKRMLDPQRREVVKQGNELHDQGKEQLKLCGTCMAKLLETAAKIGGVILVQLQVQLEAERRTGRPGGPETPVIPVRGGPGTPSGTRPGRTDGPSGSPGRDGRTDNQCVMAAEDARRQLFEAAAQLESLWQRNLQSTGNVSRYLWESVVRDMQSLAATGLTVFDYLQRNSQDPVGAVQRDLQQGILKSDLGKFLADPVDAIAHPAPYAKYDPIKLIRGQVERFEGLMKVNPDHAVADAIKFGAGFVKLPGGFNGLPSCAPVRNAASAVRNQEAVQVARRIVQTKTATAYRAEQLTSDWGRVRKTGAFGTNGRMVLQGTVFNPQCGRFNCFPVALAKARTLATGRQYSASAIRPSMTADVTVEAAEVEQVLSALTGLRDPRNVSLYTGQELLEHALGRPIAMTKDRIEDIIQRSGVGAQGLVFISYKDEKDEIVGHVFNVFHERGIARFVDETVFAANDATFWLQKAIGVFFYEYVTPN